MPIYRMLLLLITPQINPGLLRSFANLSVVGSMFSIVLIWIATESLGMKLNQRLAKQLPSEYYVRKIDHLATSDPRSW